MHKLRMYESTVLNISSTCIVEYKNDTCDEEKNAHIESFFYVLLYAHDCMFYDLLSIKLIVMLLMHVKC